MDRVVVYVQPDCFGCENVKGFLEKNGVPYIERDISADETAYREFQSLGLPATPVTVVGPRRILGFNRRALTQALGLERPRGR
ncbi:MAG: glutaredoxin family protein [Chloroflexi bacterium]|nr:glutaredoxin family protein [Chloroflexota bacterium]